MLERDPIRERVLDAAEAVWAAEGDAGLTLARVCQMPGVGRTSIYGRWGRFPEGLQAVKRAMVDRAVADLWIAMHPGPGLLSPKVYIDLVTERPALLRLMVLGRGPDGIDHEDLLPIRQAVWSLFGGRPAVAALHGLITEGVEMEPGLVAEYDIAWRHGPDDPGGWRSVFHSIRADDQGSMALYPVYARDMDRAAKKQAGPTAEYRMRRRLVTEWEPLPLDEEEEHHGA